MSHSLNLRLTKPLNQRDRAWGITERVIEELPVVLAGTQFTCFTSTKVQILTPEAQKCAVLTKPLP